MDSERDTGGLTVPFTIFIVDDEPDVARLAAKRLRSLGYEVVCCSEGKKALKEIRKKPPQLILLDIRLPDVSGLDLFQTLRSDEALKTIPIVFFSAHSSKEEYCLSQLGAEGFIKKPYDPKELKDLISRLVARTTQERV